MRSVSLAAFICLVATLPMAAADEVPKRSVEQDADVDLLKYLGHEQSIEEFLVVLLRPIRSARVPGRLTRTEVDDRSVHDNASGRAATFSAMLALDLDDDGRLSGDELKKGGQSGALDTGDWMESDANKDGSLDLTEIWDRARLNYKPAARANDELARLLLELDADGDGATTAAEAETHLRGLFARYDKNGDGVLDSTEQKVVSDLARQHAYMLTAQKAARQCGMPVASPGARIAVFQAARLQTISNVALSGPDKATVAATVLIEPGDGRIFLVLSSTSDVVWRVEGATGRLERVVLLEGTSPPRISAAAIVGVDPAIVSWATQKDCIERKNDSSYANRIYETLHGRPIDIAREVDTVLSVSVPSLNTIGEQLPKRRQQPCKEGSEADEASPQPCGWIRRELLSQFVGGVANFDPKLVVSRGPVERYDILPSPAGYLAALESGVLSDHSAANRTRYRIEKPLGHFPPFVYDGWKIVFELAPGIAVPAGDTSRFCILDDKGAVVVKGRVNRCLNVD